MHLSRLTIIFGFFIVVSASFMRQVFGFLYDNIGKRPTVVLLGAVFVLIFVAIYSRILRLPIKIRRKIFFFIVFALGLYLSWQLKIVAERIHILEYGLLGYLATRDLLKNSINFKAIIFLVITITFFAFLDEGFQYVLPYRVWELRDVGLNMTGGLWGMGLFLIKNPLCFSSKALS